MCSNGRTHKVLLTVYLLVFSFSKSFAEEKVGGWIAMPGQLKADYGKGLEKNEKNKKSSSVFFPIKQGPYLGDEEKQNTKKSAFISGKVESFNGDLKESAIGSSIQVPGVVGTKSFKAISNKKILERIDGKWNSSFTFSYIKDNYDYDDRNNIFDSVYREGANSSGYGTLLLKFKERLFSVFYYGGNIGFGYSRGKGFFIPDGVELTAPEESNIEFKLYTVPVEISFGFKKNLGSYISLGANMAPGIMGIWQHRDDRDYQDDSKNLRQIGVGYSAEVSLGVNVSQISKQYGVELLADYQVSNFALELFGRNQSYSKFKQADLEISGTSFGIGVTFDYL